MTRPCASDRPPDESHHGAHHRPGGAGHLHVGPAGVRRPRDDRPLSTAANLAGAATARWLALSPGERANAGLMAPSHTLRENINAIVRECLVRDGSVYGPAATVARLVSRGYTSAEKALAVNNMPGDTVAFHRAYKRLGVDKGDELRVASVDRAAHTANLDGADGQVVAWEPGRLAARAGGVEVYRGEQIGLRAGDRIRWTRNDAGRGLVNNGTAEVAAVRDGRVTFRL